MPQSLNQAAMQIIGPILDDPQRYGALMIKTPKGATILDMGLEALGSWLGAKMYVEAAHGGMADVTFGRMQIKDLEVATVELMIDDPMLSVVSCEAGAWKLGDGDFVPVGSGPARAKARAEPWATRIEYEDPSDYVLLQMQINRLPEEAVLEFVADACKIPLSNLTVMVAPSASLVGSVQVASRAFEQCIIGLGRNTDFDIKTIKHGYGRAPIAPVIKDEVKAMGRINDALVYGGIGGMWLDHPDDDEMRRTAEALPFPVRAGDDYGKG
ncbi:MAG: hypothetical protein MUP44_01860, partial [Anaerolineales bacterium]|nr:hypothetical protein [Anaerolineales bacterium]